VANGATAGTVPISLTVEAGYYLSLPDQGTLRKEGYTFTGWNTRSNGTGTFYRAWASFIVNEDTTLYAMWEANTYTVTFNANGGTGTVPSQTTNRETIIALPGGDTLSRSNYTFIGWNTNSYGTGTDYGPGEWFPVSGNITLYAKWEEE
jgi:uncharacterized repeat protein (TIGR02543 family)